MSERLEELRKKIAEEKARQAEEHEYKVLQRELHELKSSNSLWGRIRKNLAATAKTGLQKAKEAPVNDLVTGGGNDQQRDKQ